MTFWDHNICHMGMSIYFVTKNGLNPKYRRIGMENVITNKESKLSIESLAYNGQT